MQWQLLFRKSIVKSQVLPLNENFQGICFGHVFFKACQYLTTNEKVCKKLRFISMKSTQSNLQKCMFTFKVEEGQTGME
jgi:hypothetical protein